MLANTPGDRSKAANWILLGVASVVALVYGVVGSLIVSHELPLDQAPDAYRNFDQRADGWTKVLLKPGLQAA